MLLISISVIRKLFGEKEAYLASKRSVFYRRDLNLASKFVKTKMNLDNTSCVEIIEIVGVAFLLITVSNE